MPKLTSADLQHWPAAIAHARGGDADARRGPLGWHSHWGAHGSSFHVGWFMMPKRPLPGLEPLGPLTESNELPDLGTWNQTDLLEPLWRRKGCGDALSLSWYQNSPGFFFFFLPRYTKTHRQTCREIKRDRERQTHRETETERQSERDKETKEQSITQSYHTRLGI